MGANIAPGAQRHAATFTNHRSWERIAARVAVRIEESGMTSKALAEASGLTPNQIRNVKNGTQMPLLSVVRIARALNVTVDELIPEGAL